MGGAAFPLQALDAQNIFRLMVSHFLSFFSLSVYFCLSLYSLFSVFSPLFAVFSLCFSLHPRDVHSFEYMCRCASINS